MITGSLDNLGLPKVSKVPQPSCVLSIPIGGDWFEEIARRVSNVAEHKHTSLGWESEMGISISTKQRVCSK